MNRSDWEAVRDALIADDRARLGEPPTVDELLAYERDELSAEDAERVRQLLVAYPELAKAFATEFPSEADDDLPADVVERQWTAFRGAARPRGGVLLFWRSVSAIAASVAIAFGALLWQAQRALVAPRVLPEAAILTPDGRRGPGEQPQATITPSGDRVLLIVSIVGPIDYDTYRLELVSANARKVIWSSAVLPRADSNSFNVELPARRLAAGKYEVIAYGVRGTAQEQVATYTFDIKNRGGS